MKLNHTYLSTILLFFLCCFSTALKAQSESDIVITEIMYNPPESGTDVLEFIELYNKSTSSIDLSGYTFSQGVTYTFPEGIIIEGGAYQVIAVDAVAFEAFFGVAALEWESGALSNGGEDIVLLDASGNTADIVDYDDEGDWVTEADGGGPSLVLCNPTEDNAIGTNWSFATTSVGVNPDGLLVLAHPNGTCSGVDLIPPSPLSLSVVNASELIVRFNEELEEGSAENLDNYSGLEIASISLTNTKEVSIQLTTPLTLGIFEELEVANIQDLAGNAMPEPVRFDVVFNDTKAALVITEIMYNDPSQEDSLEFIELQYLGTETAQIGGYTFANGVDFTFPTMTVEPNEYIVISKIPDFIQEFFGVNSLAFSGGLRNGGETVEIQNTAGEEIDRVDYEDAEPWAVEADGEGYSLNLCDATTDNIEAANWSIATEMDLAGIYQGTNVYATPGTVGCKTDVGIETFDGTQISLYPNPSHGQLFIQTDGDAHWRVRILNLFGKEMLETKTFQNHLQLELTHFNTGIYFVHFQGENEAESYVERIVVE